MRKKLCVLAVIGVMAVVTACGASEDKQTTAKETTSKKETEAKTTDSATESADSSEKETSADAKTYEVKIEELKIPNGENTIYGKIYYPDAEGKFPAVIMSHGYNGTNADFVTECKYYAQNGYVSYAFDFCGGSGASKSTGKSTDMSVFTEKNDVIAIFNYFSEMDRVDKDKIFLFGGSQGGLVTALATEELGDKVAGMALYFPAFNIPDDWRKTYPTADKIPDTNDYWGLLLGRKFFEDIHDFQVFDNIGTYSKNVLILHGDKDAIVPISYANRAVDTYPNAELIIMNGEGHGFTPAGAAKAKEEVLKFLNANK